MTTAINRSQIDANTDPNQILTRILGPAFAKYRQDFALAEAGHRPQAPLHLDVDVTTACNLRCPMCPAGNTGNIFPGFKPNLFMDRKIYSLAIAEGKKWNLPSIRLGITGEPLLVPDIDQWVIEAKEAGVIDLSLITNGLLLTPDTIRALIKAGLTRLMISIDAATPQNYAQVRPGGQWDLLLNNIHTFLKLREEAGAQAPLLRLSFVEMEINQNERDKFKQIFSPLADYLSFQRYQNILGSQASNALAPLASPPKPVGQHFCPEPFTRMALHVNGGLFPCCSDFGRQRPLGHVETGGILATWQSKDALELTAPTARNLVPCQACLSQ